MGWDYQKTNNPEDRIATFQREICCPVERKRVFGCHKRLSDSLTMGLRNIRRFRDGDETERLGVSPEDVHTCSAFWGNSYGMLV